MLIRDSGCLDGSCFRYFGENRASAPVPQSPPTRDCRASRCLTIAPAANFGGRGEELPSRSCKAGRFCRYTIYGLYIVEPPATLVAGETPQKPASGGLRGTMLSFGSMSGLSLRGRFALPRIFPSLARLLHAGGLVRNDFSDVL